MSCKLILCVHGLNTLHICRKCKNYIYARISCKNELSEHDFMCSKFCYYMLKKYTGFVFSKVKAAFDPIVYGGMQMTRFMSIVMATFANFSFELISLNCNIKVP